MKAQDDMSENELSRRSKVSQPTIHRILTGESQDPRHETLTKIARVFRKTANDMYSDDSSEDLKGRADEMFDRQLTDAQYEAIRCLIEAFRK